MPDQSVNCPKCGEKIQISEVLSRDIEDRTRRELLIEFKRKEEALSKQLQDRESGWMKQLQQKDEEMRERLVSERKRLELQIKKAAEEEISLELSDLKTRLEESARKLDDARRQELTLRKKQSDLEEREASLKLEVARTLDAERARIRMETEAKFAEEHQFKDAEKDKMLSDMRRQIDELKRKAEQGSQQTQGEVLELEIEALLKKEFPFDRVEPVGKGVRGGDVLQMVNTQSGRFCGLILWETKRTKTWSEGWIQKLKDDQREAKADIAVLVSETLPKGFNRFRQIDNVWVTDFPSAIGLALALRMSLMEVAKAREALVGKSEKMELVYNYLTGPEFRSRIEAVVEAFRCMQTDLLSEKTAMEKIWAKREKQMNKVVANMAGMRGDLEGISGANLPSIPILELEPEEHEKELL